MGKERIKYIAALLLSLTVWYQCCTTLFSHTHTIGRYRITHSHPYTGTSDNPCHSHTAAQFLTIALLSAFTALAAMLAGAAAAAPASMAASAVKADSRAMVRNWAAVCEWHGLSEVPV